MRRQYSAFSPDYAARQMQPQEAGSSSSPYGQWDVPQTGRLAGGTVAAPAASIATAVQSGVPVAPSLAPNPYLPSAVSAFSDPQALLAKYLAARPQAMEGPTKSEELMRWLAGIAGAVDSREPLGVNLLKMAAGGAGGMASSAAEQRAVRNRNQQTQDQFALGGVELERAAGEARAKQLLSAAALGADNNQLLWKGELQRQMLEMQLRQKHPLLGLLGGQGGTADLSGLSGVVSPKDVLLLAMSKPGMQQQLTEQMKKSGMALASIIGLDNPSRADMLAQQVLSQFAQANPEGYAQLQAEAVQQYVLRKALNKAD